MVKRYIHYNYGVGSTFYSFTDSKCKEFRILFLQRKNGISVYNGNLKISFLELVLLKNNLNLRQ